MASVRTKQLFFWSLSLLTIVVQSIPNECDVSCNKTMSPDSAFMQSCGNNLAAPMIDQIKKDCITYENKNQSNQFMWNMQAICQQKDYQFNYLDCKGPCPEGFEQDVFGGSCYFISTESAQFSEAKVACGALGGVLASVDTIAEHEYLKPKLTGSYFVSGERLLKGIYWSSGNNVTYGWSSGEPNNVGDNENCVEFRVSHNYNLNDLPCDKKRGYICETSKSPPCPANYVQLGQECFFFHNDSKNWDDADAACVDSGDKLVAFSGATEQSKLDLVRDYLRQEDDGLDYWTSGHWSSFLWGDGKPLPDDFSAWAAGQPDNVGNAENCVETEDSDDHGLADVPCSIAKQYICEIKAPCRNGFIYEPSTCKCYMVSDTTKTRSAAVNECKNSDATLVSLETDEEFALVNYFFLHIGFWTSASRNSGFVWAATWKPLSRSFYGWKGGEPNNSGGQEHCVQLKAATNFWMNDEPCGSYSKPLCELPIDQQPGGWIENANAGSCYHFGNGMRTKNQANDYCKNRNSSLVSFETAQEFLFVKNQLSGSSRWTSASRYGGFLWRGDGAVGPLRNSNSGWRTGEPNNVANKCVDVADDGLFRDSLCSKPIRYVCEAPGVC